VPASFFSSFCNKTVVSVSLLLLGIIVPTMINFSPEQMVHVLKCSAGILAKNIDVSVLDSLDL